MKKFYLGILSAAVMTALFTVSAFAATITQVDFYTSFDENESPSTTPVDLEFETTSTEYDLSYECTSSSSTGKNEVTYRLVFTAMGSNTFPSSASAVTINGTGINSITSSTVKDSGDVLEVKVKAYQLVQIGEPTDVEEGETKLTWSSETSGTFEYVIVWEDYDGDTQEKHGTTTSKSVSISSYNKEYSGSSSDKQDRKVTGYWVRQTKMNNSSNPYVVPSNWVGDGEEPDLYDISNYESWGDYLMSDSSSVTKSATSSSGSSSSSSSAAGPGTTASSTSSAHWSGSNASGWYYYREDGSLQTGWLYTGGKWYSLDSTGLMRTGWFQDSDGQWYYLNPSTTSGIYGEMLTGWQYVNGYWYYMRPAGTAGTEGAMLHDTSVSINGTVYTFNSDGVCTNP